MGRIEKIKTLYQKAYYLFLALFFIGLCSCTPSDRSQNEVKRDNLDNVTKTDTTPGITGIGGIFFVSEKPDSLQAWYQEKMGLKTDDYGAVFEFRNALNKEELNYLRWSVFSKSNSYLKPGKADFMINYRVRNLKAYIKILESKGVLFVDTLQIYEYGKFIHLLDADSNKIELWEPVDSVLTKIGSVTNK